MQMCCSGAKAGCNPRCTAWRAKPGPLQSVIVKWNSVAVDGLVGTGRRAVVPGSMRKSVGVLDRQTWSFKGSPKPPTVTRTIENKDVDAKGQLKGACVCNPPFMERPEGRCLCPLGDYISQDMNQSRKLSRPDQTPNC